MKAEIDVGYDDFGNDAGIVVKVGDQRNAVSLGRKTDTHAVKNKLLEMIEWIVQEETRNRHPKGPSTHFGDFNVRWDKGASRVVSNATLKQLGVGGR